MAGEVIGAGSDCEGWQVGDRVFGLLPGGGYAEKAVIPAKMAMRIPDKFSYEEAAAIPEVFLTAYLNLFMLGGLQQGMHVLVHAGASGVGTAAIQLIREAGATSIATAGSPEKLNTCLELGAAHAFNYKEGPFAPRVNEVTGGRGVDIIMDFIGAGYWEQNLSCLALDGKLLIIGTMGGAKVSGINLSDLLRKRQHVIGTALRSRSVATKIELTTKFSQFAMPRFAGGQLKPVIDTVFDWQEAAKAHRYMEENRNIGKIVLRIG
jgi:putative PIG3 family NAD(P)H quinone oxidoreductase